MVNPKDVQWYDHLKGELIHPWKNKIIKFLQHGCIEKIDDRHYICKPLKGYNTRTYNIDKDIGINWWTCNCQGYKKRVDCSHLQAVMILRDHLDKKLELLRFKD